MSVSVSIPEELFRRATEVAAAQNISVDDLFASAFEQSLFEFEHPKRRHPMEAARNSCVSCRRFLPRNRPSMTASDVRSADLNFAVLTHRENYRPAQISPSGRTKPSTGPSPVMLSALFTRRGSAVSR